MRTQKRLVLLCCSVAILATLVWIALEYWVSSRAKRVVAKLLDSDVCISADYAVSSDELAAMESCWAIVQLECSTLNTVTRGVLGYRVTGLTIDQLPAKGSDVLGILPRLQWIQLTGKRGTFWQLDESAVSQLQRVSATNVIFVRCQITPELVTDWLDANETHGVTLFGCRVTPELLAAFAQPSSLESVSLVKCIFDTNEKDTTQALRAIELSGAEVKVLE